MSPNRWNLNLYHIVMLVSYSSDYDCWYDYWGYNDDGDDDEDVLNEEHDDDVS